MTIYEAEVPGVGMRYEVETGGTERLVVIIHHDGKRELFKRDHPDADAEKLFEFPASVSREIVTALQSPTFQSLDIDDINLPLGEALLEWTEIHEDSPLVGQTIGGTHLRKKTGATIAAIQRGDTTLASPDAETVLEAGDILIVIGSRAEQKAVTSLVNTGMTDDT